MFLVVIPYSAVDISVSVVADSVILPYDFYRSVDRLSSVDTKAEVDEFIELASSYPDINNELTDISKSFIMLSNLELAEAFYHNSMNNADTENDRAEAIYQLFLIYIDRNNRRRSNKKALSTYDILAHEYPASSQTIKANDYINSNM